MRFLISIFVCVLIVSACQGRTITVDDDGPADFNNIQAAINDANNGDTVEVQPGIYTGTGNRDIDFLGKAITVRSTDPNDPCVVTVTIIDCNGSGAEYHRGFNLDNGEGPNSVVNGLTIMNGYFDYGGGILCNYSSPTIMNCIIKANEASSGGGGILVVTAGSNPKIINNLLIGNKASDGAAIYTGSSSPEIINCTIKTNEASSYGGGIFCSISTPKIINSLLTGNKADNGGAIYATSSGCVPEIINCTVSGNKAVVGSGVRSFSGAECNVNNCIFENNTGDYLVFRHGGLKKSYIFVDFSIVQSSWSGTGNIVADPCFAAPGYWGDVNDTNTPVEPNDPNAVWVEGDYHLQSAAGRWDPNAKVWVHDANTSIAIDAGDPNSDWTAELWPHGKRINMGAYGGTPQASMSSSGIGNIANLNNDIGDNVNLFDLALLVDKWLYEEVLLSADLDRDGFVDFDDFDIFAENWLAGI